MGDVENIFFDFIWPRRNIMLRKEKKVLIVQGIENGGLKKPDIFATIKVIKLMWIKRLLKKSNKYSLVAEQNSKILDFQHFSPIMCLKNAW